MFLLTILLLVNINSATLSELDGLTGIGPKYAQAIIDNRPYASLDDLLRVKGIGPATLQKIKEQGLATAGEKSETNPNSQNINVQDKGYPSGIYITEILPNPVGDDETEEWIEIYNSNNNAYDLFGWKLEDTNGTKTSFLINRKILAYEYLVFKRSETKIMLNNNADGLNLLTPDGKIADFMTFTKAPLGQTYSKTSKGWAWIKPLVAVKTNTITLPKTQISDKNKTNELELAGISQPAQTGTVLNPWALFFTTLGITIISAIIVLLIKIRLRAITPKT